MAATDVVIADVVSSLKIDSEDAKQKLDEEMLQEKSGVVEDSKQKKKLDKMLGNQIFILLSICLLEINNFF